MLKSCSGDEKEIEMRELDDEDDQASEKLNLKS